MLDIDECELEDDECQQICGNTPGSYVCGCYFGFTLSSDKRSCRGKFGLSCLILVAQVIISPVGANFRC